MKRAVRIISALTGAAMLLLPLGSLGAGEETDPGGTTRTETVYVTADAAGTPREVLSSVYLVNPDGQERITDNSSLTAVTCLSSNETPEHTDDGWVFQASGDDVSYQGTADADGLPVTMSVTYTMDGLLMTPEEIAGQSGHVRVTVAYANNLKNTVAVKGEQTVLYTPITVITMVELDDSFRNVKVQNAKHLTDAGASTLIATTFPGLAASLETDAEDSLSESFWFEADTKSFVLEPITAIVVPGLLSGDDLSSMDDLEDFTNGIDELNDAGEELRDGAKSLYRGIRKYADGFDDFIDGIEDVESGSDQLHDAVASVDTDSLNSAISSAKEYAGDAADGISSALSDIQSSLPPEMLAEISGALSELGSALRSAKTAEGYLGAIPPISLNDLKKGTAELTKGLEALHRGAGTLKAGAEKLEKGARKLYRGLREFCNEGLQELDEQTDGLSITVERKDALLDLEEAYTAYSASSPESGSVKFVYSTDSIYVPKVAPPEDVPESGSSVQDEDLPVQEEKPTVTDVLDRFADFFRQLFGNKK